MNIENQDILSFVEMENSFSFTSLLPSSVKQNITISVEGNIGSGKSTLLDYFSHSQGDLIESLSEPIEKWTNVQGHNSLQLLYEDPHRWSFSFNMYALLTRVNMHTKKHVKPVKMMERSLHSTRHCFIENSFKINNLTPCEYSIISQWYDHLVLDQKGTLDAIIYLKADPHVCYSRLKKRCREEEAGVPLEFIESLHNLYEDWLINKKFLVPAPVLVLDANPDIDTMKEVYDQIGNEISELFGN